MTTATARPPREYLAVLFFVSVSMLAFEVLLVRLFEFSHWHHFAGLAVSLALLGLGTAATCLTLLGDRGPRLGDGLLLSGTAIQALGTLVVVFLHSRLALRPLFAAWDGRELSRLLLVDFAAFIPFFGAGLVIGHVFMRWPTASRSIYAANLLGAGIGSVAASVLLFILHVESVLILIALLPMLAWPMLKRRYRRTAAIVLILIGVAVLAWLPPPPPAVSDFKALSRVLDLPDARLIAGDTGLAGRLSVVRSNSLRNAPGLSLNWAEAAPTVDALVVGSDRLVPMPRTFSADTPHMEASLVGLPFRLRGTGKTLVLGASAWLSPTAARDRALVWIEPDQRLLEYARQRGVAGSDKTLLADSAYRYLTVSKNRFELITVDAAFAGGDAADEDYLMTAEGLAAALSRLKPNGILAIPLQLSMPPRHAPRAMTTLRGALKLFGVDEPGLHTAALRGLREILLLASPRPLVPADLSEIRNFAKQWRFDLVWHPGLRVSEANRYHRLEGPVFYQSAHAVFDGGSLPQAVRWFETDPAEFRRPYFWRSLKWERIPDFVRSMGRQRALSYLDWTLILTAVSALFAMMLAFVLIVAPLGRLPSKAGSYSRMSVAAYFAALGFGYMLLELAVLQRSILYLDQPVAAAALVFAVFLIGSGCGSAFAPQSPRSQAVARIFLSIAAGLLLIVTGLWLGSGVLLDLPSFGRVAVLALLIGPVAWAMGQAFPWALLQLAGHGRWVPWAWGINGFASVVAASLSTLISVQWGQPATLAASVACYVTAGCIAWRWVSVPAMRFRRGTPVQTGSGPAS